MAPSATSREAQAQRDTEKAHRTRVLVREPIAERGLELLRAHYDVEIDFDTDLDEVIADFDAIVVRSATSLTEDLLSRANRLRVIGRAGVGVDNVDLAAATRLGIVVVNAPDATVVSAAEHAIGLLLALARSIPQMDAALRDGRWERSRYQGIEIAGKTLGLVGFGRIGQQVARRAHGLEMRVIAYDPYVAPERFRELAVERTETLDELLREVDFLSLHLTLTAESAGLIGEDELKSTKPGLRVVNVARGELIDEPALVAALQSGHVAGAALDVFSSEPYSGDLLKLENVVVTPHLGASTKEAQDRASISVAEQVVAALEGSAVMSAVNLPAAAAEDIEYLSPFLNVANKLGALAVELAGGHPTRLDFTYVGELAEKDTRLLTVAALNGAFQGRVEHAVNYVNAPVVARERGIEVRESSRTASQDFTSLIEITAVSESEEILVAATPIGVEHIPRLVRVQDYEIEVELEPLMLFVVNDDRPGMIGRLGTRVGDSGINIANMAVSRNRSEGRALMALTVDSAPTDELIAELRAEPGFVEVRFIVLGSES